MAAGLPVSREAARLEMQGAAGKRRLARVASYPTRAASRREAAACASLGSVSRAPACPAAAAAAAANVASDRSVSSVVCVSLHPCVTVAL